jgi:hypothetical protein
MTNEQILEAMEREAKAAGMKLIPYLRQQHEQAEGRLKEAYRQILAYYDESIESN